MWDRYITSNHGYRGCSSLNICTMGFRIKYGYKCMWTKNPIQVLEREQETHHVQLHVCPSRDGRATGEKEPLRTRRARRREMKRVN